MAAIPILHNIDLNYSEIIKGRLENVNSLPAGLGTNEKGYSVYFESKIWVWDGTNWNTWNNNAFTIESNGTLDHTTPRTETSIISVISAYLDESIKDIYFSEGYDDDIARTLGTLHFIGANGTIADWKLLIGRRFIYTAKEGCWFNIKNTSTETLPTNERKILTGTDTDLFELVKAEFVYNYINDIWLLISFERKETWFNQYSISDSGKLGQTEFEGSVPSSSSAGLLKDGYYQVDAFFEVAEFDTDEVTRLATEQPQTLELSAPGTSWKLVDKSGHFVTSPAVPEMKWFNNSLQGSAIIFADSSLGAGSRDINWKITLPNGIKNQVLGGYIHVEYLGLALGVDWN